MMLTSLSESVVDMLCSCPPKPAGIGRRLMSKGKSFIQKKTGASAGLALVAGWSLLLRTQSRGKCAAKISRLVPSLFEGSFPKAG